VGLETAGRRAEAVITAKAESDDAGSSAGFPGAAIARFGSVVATRLPDLADHAPYNKARGFSLGDAHELADIVDFYDEVGVRPSVEVLEPDTTGELGELLGDAGFSPIADGITLHVTPTGVLPIEVSGVEIREVGRAERDRYIEVLIDAYELPSRASALRQMFAHEHTNPGVRRYLAWVDGAPAAAAALYTRDGTGLFVGAATLPGFRRHGCRSALIARRLADAAADSDLVVVTAAAGSASQENLARHGFATTHHRTLWRQHDETP
jgi:GNAT superfamily N-acetyltransferase